MYVERWGGDDNHRCFFVYATVVACGCGREGGESNWMSSRKEKQLLLLFGRLLLGGLLLGWCGLLLGWCGLLLGGSLLWRGLLGGWLPLWCGLLWGCTLLGGGLLLWRGLLLWGCCGRLGSRPRWWELEGLLDLDELAGGDGPLQGSVDMSRGEVWETGLIGRMNGTEWENLCQTTF